MVDFKARHTQYAYAANLLHNLHLPVPMHPRIPAFPIWSLVFSYGHSGIHTAV